MSQSDDNQIVQTITVGGRTIEVRGTVNLQFTEIVKPPVPEPDKPPVEPQQPPTTTEPTKPTQGTVKKGGWGANMDPKTWMRTAMKDDPKLFKVTDENKKNVATHFTTAENADNFIKFFQRHPDQVSTFFDVDTDDNDQGEQHSDAFKGEDNPSQIMIGPYPMVQGGKQLGSTVRGPTTRNYASGKPSDETIERNTKGINYPNHQAILKTTFPKTMEHNDNWSIKFGGDHMKNGWYDFGIDIYKGDSCGGNEPDHPNTNLCEVKGKSVGDLRGRTCFMAVAWWKDTNKGELWFKADEAAQWEKLVEGVDVGGFRSKAKDNFEVQQRIDGFEKNNPPHIHYMVVQPIA